MPAPPEDDDDFELELEPVDPAILEHERQRAQRKTDEAITKATFDELQEQRPDLGYGDYDIDLSKLRQFRFTTRHLLILTAVLAVGLTLTRLVSGCMAIFIATMALLGVAWYMIYRKERAAALDLERRRREFLAARGSTKEAGLPTAAEAWVPDPQPVREFRFAFSMRQLLIAMTASAVFLAVFQYINPKALTITLGVVALVGIAVQTMGWFDPPPVVVFAWWVLLACYLALGLLTAFFPALMGAGRTIAPGAPLAPLLCYCSLRGQ
jgi:hypothetical protein